MDPDELPGFSYSIQDPFDPSRIKGTRSSSFVLPATRAARSIAGPLAMSEDVDPVREIVIGESGVDYVRGKVVTMEASEEGYRLASISENASWLEAARDTNIQDLDLGESLTLRLAILASSWTASEDEALYFPLIDYGQVLDTDDATTDTSLNHIRPAVRVNNILKRFFADQGYSLKIDGNLTRYWKKLIVANTHDDIEATHLDLFGAQTSNPVPQIFTPSDTLPFDEVPQLVVDSDPSGLIAAFKYTPTVDCEVKVTMEISFAVEYAAQVSGLTAIPVIFWLLDNFDNGTSKRVVYVQNYYGLGPQTVKVTLEFPITELTAGSTYAIYVQRYGATVPTLFRVNSSTITWEVIHVPYQMGITIDVASVLPDMRAMDLIKSVLVATGSLPLTNDFEKTVTFIHMDDYYRPHDRFGVDLTKRIDHPVTIIFPEKPGRVLLQYAEDGKDLGLEDLDERIGERRYGGFIQDVDGGRDDDREVRLSFAPTAMRFAYGGLFIPWLHREDQTPGEPEYAWKARLLIADGVDIGDWTLDGTARTEYPNCYFIKPGEPFTLSFGTEEVYGDVVPGVAGQRYFNYFRRLSNSKIMEASIRLFDDEMIDFDFGAPVLVHDGWETVWAYFTKISGKSFGVDEFTRCQLIQE